MKKRTMNEYRQTKEYYVPKERVKRGHVNQYLQDVDNTPEEIKEIQKAKERVKRNVPRYPKSYGHDQIIEQNKDVDKHQEDLDKAGAEGSKKFWPEEIKEITLEDQIQEIAAIVAPTMYDVIFNEIIEVMDNYDDLNWGYFVQDDAPTALLDACFDHKTELHYEIFQVVLQKLK